MSEFPGYPITGSSSWIPLLATRPALPESSYLGLQAISGIPEREFIPERPVYEPLQLAALQRSYANSPYSSLAFCEDATSIPRSYSTELNHLRSFGVDSRYGIPCGIPDPRSPLFRSPGSQLTSSVSPLTFDQIYSTRDPSLISPLSYNTGSKTISGYGLELHDQIRTEAQQTFDHSFRTSPRIEQGQVPTARTSCSSRFYSKTGQISNEISKETTKKDISKQKDSAKIWKPFDTYSPEKQSQQVENNNNVADKDKNIPHVNIHSATIENENSAFMQFPDGIVKAKDTNTSSLKPTVKYPVKPVPVYEKPASEIHVESNKHGQFQSHTDFSSIYSENSPAVSPLDLLKQFSNSKPGPYTSAYRDGSRLPASSTAFHAQDSIPSFNSPAEKTNVCSNQSQADHDTGYLLKDTSTAHSDGDTPITKVLNLHASPTTIRNVNLCSPVDECSKVSTDYNSKGSGTEVPNAQYETVENIETRLETNVDCATKADLRGDSWQFETDFGVDQEVGGHEIKPETADVCGNDTDINITKCKAVYCSESQPTETSPEVLFTQNSPGPALVPAQSVTLTNESDHTTQSNSESKDLEETLNRQDVHIDSKHVFEHKINKNVHWKVKSSREISWAVTNTSIESQCTAVSEQNLITAPVIASGESIEKSSKEEISIDTVDSAVSEEPVVSDHCKVEVNISGENTFQTFCTSNSGSNMLGKSSDTGTNFVPRDIHSSNIANSNANMMKDTDNSNLSTCSQYSESDSDTQASSSRLTKMHSQHQAVGVCNEGFGPINNKGRIENDTGRHQFRPDGKRIDAGQYTDNHGIKRGDYNMCQNINQNQPYSMNYSQASNFNENSQVLPNHHFSGQNNPNFPEQRLFPTDGYGQYQRPNLKGPSTQSLKNTIGPHTRSAGETSELSATPRVGENNAVNIMNAQLKTGSDDPVLPRFNSSPAEGFVPKSEPVFSQMEDSNDGISNRHSSPANPFPVPEVEKEKDSELDQPFQWDYLHSKQFIDNVYSDQLGCEFSGVVKNEEEIRDTDSPKTFLDLDTIPKKSGMNSGMDLKQGMQRGVDSNQQQGMMGHGSYSSSSHYTNQTAFNQRQNDSQMGRNQWSSQFKSEASSGGNQIKSEGQSHYSLQQKQNIDGQSYHNNQYNQNCQSSYYQNQPGGQNMKNYQGNYSDHGRYEGNYYNQGMPPKNGSSNGHSYGNQPYPGQTYSSSEYNSKSPSHMGEDLIPEEIGKKKPKKRGRKRKCDKDPAEESKPHPNTIVMASTKVGALIDPDRPECPTENYGYHGNVETIYNFTFSEDLPPLAQQYLQIEQRICQRLLPHKYGWPTNVIYNPLVYAFQTHKLFVRRYCTSPRPILFLGMNPGPYGMSQNGVPFGEVGVVRDWMKIQGNIYKPETEHPKKPIHGLGCTRCEVSGSRFWGLFQKICKVPENFFKNCFVYNFCPQAYMSESGKNITPPQLATPELEQINEACDTGLVELVNLLNIHIIIGVGKFVQTRATKALHNAGISNVKVECILHPSPINPHANKGWEQIVAKQLIEMGVMHYLNSDMDDVQRAIGEWEQIAAQNAKVKFDEDQQEC